jgi:hypothetical protein
MRPGAEAGVGWRKDKRDVVEGEQIVLTVREKEGDQLGTWSGTWTMGQTN